MDAEELYEVIVDAIEAHGFDTVTAGGADDLISAACRLIVIDKREREETGE